MFVAAAAELNLEKALNMCLRPSALVPAPQLAPAPATLRLQPSPATLACNHLRLQPSQVETTRQRLSVEKYVTILLEFAHRAASSKVSPDLAMAPIGALTKLIAMPAALKVRARIRTRYARAKHDADMRR